MKNAGKKNNRGERAVIENKSSLIPLIGDVLFARSKREAAKNDARYQVSERKVA